MHVESIRLKRFKKFRDSGLDFTDSETGLARPLVVLVGENGSGKSTILQAIAATLGTATRRLREPADLEWPGFDLGLAGNAWALPSEVTLRVGFSNVELDATVEYFDMVSDELQAGYQAFEQAVYAGDLSGTIVGPQTAMVRCRVPGTSLTIPSAWLPRSHRLDDPRGDGYAGDAVWTWLAPGRDPESCTTRLPAGRGERI